MAPLNPPPKPAGFTPLSIAGLGKISKHADLARAEGFPLSLSLPPAAAATPSPPASTSDLTTTSFPANNGVSLSSNGSSDIPVFTTASSSASFSTFVPPDTINPSSLYISAPASLLSSAPPAAALPPPPTPSAAAEGPSANIPTSIAIPNDEDDDSIDELSSDDDGPLAHKFPLASTSTATSSSSTMPARRPIKRARASTPDNAVSNQIWQIPLPHHSVRRSAGTIEQPHVIALNPDITDASPSRWPTSLTPNHSSDGTRNWYEEIPPDEGRHLNWRRAIGRGLAELLGLVVNPEENWILDSLPTNWRFYIHYSGKNRTDPYAIGSTYSNRFRTVREIIPHIYWMIKNGPGEHLVCCCKYCSKSTQREVNAAVGLGDVQFPSADRHDRIKRPKMSSQERTAAWSSSKFPARTPRVSDAVAALPKKKRKITPPPIVQFDGALMNTNRDIDLLEGGNYRKGELVWVTLEHPFIDLAQPNRSIKQWPALIVERLVNNEGQRNGDSDSKSFTISKTSYKYLVHLLSIGTNDIIRPENSITPWLAHQAPVSALEPDFFLSPEALKHVWNGSKCLRPLVANLGSAREASTAFALSIQIAAHIVVTWSLIDRYPIDKSNIITDGGPLSDADRAARDRYLNSWHYQHIWWGAEKIWVGELVRLMADPGLCIPGSGLEGPVEELRLFLKVEAIYKENDNASADGEVSTAVKLAGRFYELVEVTDPRLADLPSASSDPYIPAPPAPHLAFLRRGDGDAHVDIDYLAGRYHPLPSRLRTPQAIADVIKEDERKIAADGANASLSHDMKRIALAGIVPAHKLFMVCTGYRTDRNQACKKAESVAHREMFEFLKSPVNPVQAVAGPAPGEGA